MPSRVKHPLHYHLVDLSGVGCGDGAHFEILECGYLTNTAHWNNDDKQDPFWRLYHNAGEGAIVIVNGRRLALTPDHLIILPAGTLFHYRGKRGRQRHLWIHFQPPRHFPMSVRHFSRLLCPAVAANIDHLRHRLLHHKEGDIQDLKLIHHASHAVLDSWLVHTPFDARRQPSPELSRLLEKIDEFIPHPVSNRMLAEAAGMNVKSLVEKFRTHLNTTPARYMTMRRIRKACQLLADTGRSIEEIAGAVGFSNRHHFSRVFSQQTGRGPSQFRRLAEP